MKQDSKSLKRLGVMLTTTALLLAACAKSSHLKLNTDAVMTPHWHRKQLMAIRWHSMIASVQKLKITQKLIKIKQNTFF